MVILLYWIIEHIFYFVKTRKPLFSNLAKRPTVLPFSGAAPIERENLRDDSNLQNGYDLDRRQRRPLQRLVGRARPSKASESHIQAVSITC